MTIWILAVLLVASVTALGFRQGAMRVAFSLVGILISAAVAVPLGHLIQRVLPPIGIKNPVTVWMVAPVIAFWIVLAIFKVVAQVVHKKVEVYYKYKAGDLRLALWQRLNHQLGACLGVVNGVAYVVLLSFIIYVLSYWTVQITSPDSNPRAVRILDRLGNDLEGTGMAHVAAAVQHMPTAYYDTADLAGMAYHTPLLEARFTSYPAFLGLAEKPEFQSLGKDDQFTKLWQTQASVGEIMNDQNVQAILHNPDMLKTVWGTVQPNLDDLHGYLTNGVSAKYDSMKLVGRWDFDVNGAIALLRKARPTIPSSEMGKLKKFLAASFANTSFVATPEKEVFLKNVPHVKATPGQPPTTEMQTSHGTWSKSGEDTYDLSMDMNGQTESLKAELHGSRLTVIGTGTQLAFDRDE